MDWLVHTAQFMAMSSPHVHDRSTVTVATCIWISHHHLLQMGHKSWGKLHHNQAIRFNERHYLFNNMVPVDVGNAIYLCCIIVTISCLFGPICFCYFWYTIDGLSTELRNVSDAQLMIIVILSPILLLLVLVPQLPGHIIFEGSLPAFRLFEVPDHQLQFSLSVSSVSYVSNGTGSCNNTILVILECIFLAW
jgi:hypothetical protein